MKRKSSGAVWGVMLILLGVLIGGKILNWFRFDLFFRGWWSLFLIIPCAVRFLTERGERISALKGLFAGVLLLMAAQNFIEYSMLFPLLLAGFLVLTGLKMILPGVQKRGRRQAGKESWRQKEEKRRERERRRAEKSGGRWAERYEDAFGSHSSVEYEYYDENLREESPEDAGGGEDYQFTAEDSADFERQAGQFEWNQYANRGEYRRDYSDRAGFGSTYFGGAAPGGRRGPDGAGRNGQYGGGWQRRGGAGPQDFARTDASRIGKAICTSVFTGKEIRFRREPFEGAVLSAVIGAIDQDLREAVISHDTVVEAITVMGGIDIHVPDDVYVVVSGSPFLGGIDNHVKQRMPYSGSGITIFIKATCIMGGIEIK